MPEKTQKVRVKSIARRLNFALISRKFLKTLVIDVLAIAVIMGTWCVATEKQNIGDGGHVSNRRFEGALDIEKSIEYFAELGNDTLHLSEDEVKAVMRSHLPFSGIYYCFDVTSNSMNNTETPPITTYQYSRVRFSGFGFALEYYNSDTVEEYIRFDVDDERYLSPEGDIVRLEEYEDHYLIVDDNTDSVLREAEKLPGGKFIELDDGFFRIICYNIIDGNIDTYSITEYTLEGEEYTSPDGTPVYVEDLGDYCTLTDQLGNTESIPKSPIAASPQAEADELTAETSSQYTESEGKFIETENSQTITFNSGSSTQTITHVRVSAAVILTLLCVIFILFFVFQLLEFLIGTISGSGVIRRYLKPIDDIAIMAEKLSSAESQTQQVSRDELSEQVKRKINESDKSPHVPVYNEKGELVDDTDITTAELSSLAYAIDSIDDSKKRIDVHDTELSGLEAAVNNMLRRLEEAKLKQIRFVDDASHELRTPIAVIQGYVSMLDRWGKDDPAIMDEAITAIKNESEHMKTLIDQLLFLARGEMNRHVLDMKIVNAGKIMEEIYDESILLEAELPENEQHEFSAEALYVTPESTDDNQDNDPQLCQYFITADEAMIKQSIRILRDNAMRYTPPGGKISFKVYERADTLTNENKVCLEVSDTGIGISKSELPRIFDRFYRGSNARADNSSGSGLGLSIARWIIEEHNGSIEAISSSGFGTKMTIILSRSDVNEP